MQVAITLKSDNTTTYTTDRQETDISKIMKK